MYLTIQSLQQQVEEQKAQLKQINEQLQQEVAHRSKVEEALQKAQECLENKIQKRTLQLAQVNTQLRQEIRERKQSEALLRESQERFRVTFEQAAVGITHVGTEGHFLRVNSKLCDILGYTREEILRLTCQSITHPDDLDGELEYVRQMLVGEIEAYSLEKRYIRKDGKYIWTNLTVSLVHHTSGEPKYFIAVVEDISDRKGVESEIKHAQAEIQQLNETLEQSITKRTAQLEAANQELEAFSYSVSHDLRAPLRALHGFSGILNKRYGYQLSPKAKHYLERIEVNAKKMGCLIDDLLKFSRLNRQPLNKQWVDMMAIVREVFQELDEQQLKRQIEFEIANIPPCQADPALLHQVWINLISNALKYSSQRKIAQIKLGCKNVNHGLAYYIKDNGVGFDMRYSHKLFGVFQRLHTEEEFEGTGVGLANAQRIIHRHGGCIWAEAEVNQGATFYFTLEGGSAIDQQLEGAPNRSSAG
ncbi:MAG: PAS domain S-box protein [Symploca sp. SIO2E9]|nr:PAS domain S-box protein [Symploca sp. SIO2E9]